MIFALIFQSVIAHMQTENCQCTFSNPSSLLNHVSHRTKSVNDSQVFSLLVCTIANRLKGATVYVTDKEGALRSMPRSSVCGSPVTAAQARVAGGTVTMRCNTPIAGKYIYVGIVANRATLQLCEVKVWTLPMDKCVPGAYLGPLLRVHTT